jgi:hypothetical protein
MKRFRILFNMRTGLQSFNKEAAIDSMRNVLAVLGLGVLIGDFATMHLPYVIPGAALFLAVWYADYLRHDFPAPAVIGNSDNAGSVNPLDQLKRAS